MDEQWESSAHNSLFCCNHTCYCVNTISVTSVSQYITSASCYHRWYRSRFSMYIRGLDSTEFAEWAEAVQIGGRDVPFGVGCQKLTVILPA